MDDVSTSWNSAFAQPSAHSCEEANSVTMISYVGCRLWAQCCYMTFWCVLLNDCQTPWLERSKVHWVHATHIKLEQLLQRVSCKCDWWRNVEPHGSTSSKQIWFETNAIVIYMIRVLHMDYGTKWSPWIALWSRQHNVCNTTCTQCINRKHAYCRTCTLLSIDWSIGSL